MYFWSFIMSENEIFKQTSYNIISIHQPFQSDIDVVQAILSRFVRFKTHSFTFDRQARGLSSVARYAASNSLRFLGQLKLHHCFVFDFRTSSSRLQLSKLTNQVI